MSVYLAKFHPRYATSSDFYAAGLFYETKLYERFIRNDFNLDLKCLLYRNRAYKYYGAINLADKAWTILYVYGNMIQMQRAVGSFLIISSFPINTKPKLK